MEKWLLFFPHMDLNGCQNGCYIFFDNFSVLAHENKKYLLEIKESLLIMRDKPSLNRNIDKVSI